MRLSGHSPEDIAHAAGILRAGGLVAFPTETVYGLGADAANDRAVRRIYDVKGRPADHPLIVHLGDPAQVALWARDVPAKVRDLAERFWPGPLTLILKRAPGVSSVVTGGQDTIGLRMPDHPEALALLRAFGGGIAAPSANRFGRLSPTTAVHVRTDLGESVDYIIDGGSCRVGIESTILDLSSARPRRLRPGAIDAAELEAVLGEPLAMSSGDVPRAPGMLPSHYAPKTPLTLVPFESVPDQVRHYAKFGERVAVLARLAAMPQIECVWQFMPPDPDDYAFELYARLRALDGLCADRILVEAPPGTTAWESVRDRLERAACAHPDNGGAA